MPQCDYCGFVHDGQQPKCPKCGNKVKMMDVSNVSSLDDVTMFHAKRAKLLAGIACAGMIFMPVGFVFGILAIKHAKKVEKGMYLQHAKQAIWISIVAMIMSVVMMVIRLILAPDMLYNALQGIYKFISALISPERPY